MPELPEVETIKNQLSHFIAGKKIKKVEVILSKIIKAPLKDFQKAVRGAKIKSISRRAKLLILNLSTGYSLLIHLKLTGQLIYSPQGVQGKNKYTHLIFIFGDGSRLFYNDLRQFGYWKVIKTEQLAQFLVKENYGPEPLEKKFTLTLFQKLLSRRSQTKIKPLLMEQKFIAGLGNIYADEICFYAGVKPERKTASLSEKEIAKIFQGIKKILARAISRRGSSVDTYLDARGQKGSFVPLLQVYGRENQACRQCGRQIQRIKLGSRSAHFCPFCQK